MAYTGHGHHIPGTQQGTGTIGEIVQCGGVTLCPRCKSEVASTISIMVGQKENFQEKAMDLVKVLVDERLEENDDTEEYDLYVVWFSKTLKNWKALVATTMADGMYYEVTHDGNKGETYVDSYQKIGNHTFLD